MTVRATAGGRTLGVVVVHRPGRAIADLPAVAGLAAQVDDLLVVRNGDDGSAVAAGALPYRLVSFETNRGTAAAWNTALSCARQLGCRYLYILDQDSIPSPGAVASALAEVGREGVAAVVQPPSGDRLGLVSFPWNTVASGSLYEVDALDGIGGFDERLFVDEVDHEVLARLIAAGRNVRPLTRPTIAHRAGSPREIRMLFRRASILGHEAERQRLRGYSTGMLLRRYACRAPGVSAMLLGREALLLAKDLLAGEWRAAGALVSGLASGTVTGGPPSRAAQRACPYCGGPLVGRFAAVPDWRFGTGSPADVYRCTQCGALAAGTSPDMEQVASWYSEYYTHSVEPVPSRLWRRLWPTRRRRAEMERQHWFFTPPAPAGRFLEVGTGSGERLVQFAGAGWEAVGQDIDPQAGHLARQQGIKVHGCPVSDLVGREKPFDLIGLSHVLEHATDPGEMLQACAALLTPNGRICVISPNAQGLGRLLFGRWWFGLEQPRHLAIPTVHSLLRLTSSLGLETDHAASMATNGAVILGGSLARPLFERLPEGRLHGGVRFATALLGQAMGRAALQLDHRLGEEVMWVGRRANLASSTDPG